MLDLPPSQRVHTEYARNLIRMKSRQLLRRPEFWRDDRHDIEQDLWLHLLSRSAHFDPSRGSVNGFIACVVRTGVANLVRQHQRQLQSPDSGAQSLEPPTGSSARSSERPSSRTFCRSNFRTWGTRPSRTRTSPNPLCSLSSKKQTRPWSPRSSPWRRKSAETHSGWSKTIWSSPRA